MTDLDLLFADFAQLPRIVDVVPDRVKTAGKRTNGIEKGVCQPNDKYGVLLPERLSGGDLRYFYCLVISLSADGIVSADAVPCFELEYAAHK